jgi:ribose 5-phosphate isomerase B
MKIAAGSDHAGFRLKSELVRYLQESEYEVLDMGTDSCESVDYPDFAEKVCDAVVGGQAEMGLLICGTGIGMAMAANKVDGIRAASCCNEYMAEMSRSHNNANVLTLGARILTPEIAERILDIFLVTEFEGGRHERRVDKIMKLGEKRR